MVVQSRNTLIITHQHMGDKQSIRDAMSIVQCLYFAPYASEHILPTAYMHIGGLFTANVAYNCVFCMCWEMVTANVCRSDCHMHCKDCTMLSDTPQLHEKTPRSH